MFQQRQELLQFALHLAKTAEAHIMPYYRNCTVQLKPDGSEVTEADQRAEQVVRDLIMQHAPDHAILGEEFGETAPTASRYTIPC